MGSGTSKPKAEDETAEQHDAGSAREQPQASMKEKFTATMARTMKQNMSLVGLTHEPTPVESAAAALASDIPWPGERAKAVLSAIEARASRSHFNGLRCEALAKGCKLALAEIAKASEQLSDEEPIRYRLVAEAMLEALEAAKNYVEHWTLPGWLKHALDAVPKEVSGGFEGACAGLSVRNEVNSRLEAIGMMEGAQLNALHEFLERIAEQTKDFGDAQDDLLESWQNLQGLWGAAEESSFGHAEVEAIQEVLKVGEASLSDELSYARGLMKSDPFKRTSPAALVAHKGLQVFWRRCFMADKIPWASFWEAFPSKLGEELERDPEGLLGLGGLMGDEETSSALRKAVETYAAAGGGRGAGLSIHGVNVLFPSQCDLGGRLKEIQEAAKAKGGLMRLTGMDRLKAAPKDCDGVFVGRSNARAELQTLLTGRKPTSASLVLLQGPAGVGKSALALQVSKECLFPKGWATAYYADLSDCRTSEDLALKLLFMFQVPRKEISVAAGDIRQSHSPEARLLMWLKSWHDAQATAGSPAGLVLDHMDRLLDFEAEALGEEEKEEEEDYEGERMVPGGLWELLAKIQSVAPLLRLVITSREADTMPDSAKYFRVVVGALEAEAAMELLCSVAPVLNDPKHSSAVQQLVPECGGLPHALRAVAQVLGSGGLSPEELLDNLAQLESSSAIGVVSTCLQQPWYPGHFELMGRLVAIPGSFSAETAAAVLAKTFAGGKRTPAQALRALAASGLLQESEHMGEVHWTVQPSLRECVSLGTAEDQASASASILRCLLGLLAEKVSQAQTLLHERVAGWASAHVMAKLSNIIAAVLPWLESSVSPPTAENAADLVRILECRAALSLVVSCECHTRLARATISIAENTAPSDLQGRAQVAAAVATGRGEGGPREALAQALAGLKAMEEATAIKTGPLADGHLVTAELALAAEDTTTALQHYQRCLDIHESSKGEMHTDTGRCQNNIGGIFTRLGRWDDAELSYRSALHCFQTLHGETSLLAAMAMSNLGSVMVQHNELEQAETWYSAALETERLWLAPDAPPLLALLNNIGDLMDQMMRPHEAEKFAKEVVEAKPWRDAAHGEDLELELERLNKMLQRVKPSSRDVKKHAKEIKVQEEEKEKAARELEEVSEESPLTQEMSDPMQRKLQVFKMRLGQYDTVATDPDAIIDPQTELKARIELTQQQLYLTEETAGESSAELIPVLDDLGTLLNQAGRYTEAQQVYTRQQQVVEKVNGPTSIEAAASINNLAAQLHCMGKYGAAMQLYLRALKIWKVPANASSTQLQVVDVLCNLGLVARACGELQEAIGYVKQAIDTEFNAKGEQYADVLGMRLRLADLLEEAGKDYDAEQLLLAVSNEMHGNLGTDNWEVGVIYGRLAAFYAKNENFAKYEKASKQAMDCWIASSATNHSVVADRLQSVAASSTLKSLHIDVEPLLNVAVRLRELAGPRAGGSLGTIAKALNQLGAVRMSKGNLPGAEKAYRRALNSLEKVAFPDPYELANAAKNLANVLDAQEKTEEAEQLYWKFLENRESQLGPDAVGNVGESMTNLAFLLQNTAEKPEWAQSALNKSALEADPQDVEASVAQRIGTSMDSGATADLLLTIGSVLERNRLQPLAEDLYKTAIKIKKASHKEDSAEAAVAHSALGVCLLGQEQMKAADEHLRAAVAKRIKVYGKQHWLVATSLNNLGTLLHRREKWNEAEMVIRQALNIRLNTPGVGPYHPLVASTLNNLASVLQAKSNLDEAEPLYRRALEIQETSQGPDSPEAAYIMNNLATLMQAKRNFKGAETILKKCLAIRQRMGIGPESPNAPQMASTLCNLGNLMMLQDRPKEAEPLLQQSLELYEGGAGNGQEVEWATAMHNYSVLLRKSGKPKEAEPICRAVVEMRTKVLGEKHSQVGEAQTVLAGLVVKRGNFLEAERLFVAAIATMENRPPREEYAFALRGHARLLTRRKAYKEAEERYAETLKTWEALKMQKKHPIVQVTLREYAETMRRRLDADNAKTTKLKVRYGVKSSQKIWEGKHDDEEGASIHGGMSMFIGGMSKKWKQPRRKSPDEA